MLPVLVYQPAPALTSLCEPHTDRLERVLSRFWSPLLALPTFDSARDGLCLVTRNVDTGMNALREVPLRQPDFMLLRPSTFKRHSFRQSLKAMNKGGVLKALAGAPWTREGGWG